MLFHNVGREEYIWHLSDAPGCLLVVSCSVLMVPGQLQQPWLKKGISDQGVRPLSNEDLGHPPGKPLRLVQVLAKRGEGDGSGTPSKAGIDEYRMWPQEQLQQGEL